MHLGFRGRVLERNILALIADLQVVLITISLTLAVCSRTLAARRACKITLRTRKYADWEIGRANQSNEGGPGRSLTFSSSSARGAALT